jgi:hypothetical protein
MTDQRPAVSPDPYALLSDADRDALDANLRDQHATRRHGSAAAGSIPLAGQPAVPLRAIPEWAAGLTPESLRFLTTEEGEDLIDAAHTHWQDAARALATPVSTPEPPMERSPFPGGIRSTPEPTAALHRCAYRVGLHRKDDPMPCQPTPSGEGLRAALDRLEATAPNVRIRDAAAALRAALASAPTTDPAKVEQP